MTAESVQCANVLKKYVAKTALSPGWSKSVYAMELQVLENAFAKKQQTYIQDFFA